MTIPPDHELAALRALLELRTRERDEERAKVEQARKAAIEEAAQVCEDACGQCEEYVGRDLTCPTCPARLAFDIRSLLDTGGNGHG